MTAARGPHPFLIPGDLDSPTGGYAYARALIAHGPAAGLALEPVMLPGDFPFPSAESLARTAAILAGLPADRAALVDGLAFGALPDAVLTAAKAPLVVLLHHPLGLETGLGPAVAERLLEAEARALTHASAVLVPSAHVAATLTARLGVTAADITVAPPGTMALAPAPRGNRPPVILATGTVTPRKGHAVLVEALAGLAQMPWTARFVGSLDRDPACAARLRSQIAAAGLAGRIALTGAVDDDALHRHYAQADLFVLASHYEGYGMVFAEALAAGLPVVAAAGGAVPDLVPADAGILVAPGDASALRDAVAALLADPALAERLAAAARRAGARLPRWPDTAGIVRAVLERGRATGSAPTGWRCANPPTCAPATSASPAWCATRSPNESASRSATSAPAPARRYARWPTCCRSARTGYCSTTTRRCWRRRRGACRPGPTGRTPTARRCGWPGESVSCG
ncbi:MAG: glycosyltransferase family 4 protein [Alphaproteobacteria bacterium]